MHYPFSTWPKRHSLWHIERGLHVLEVLKAVSGTLNAVFVTRKSWKAPMMAASKEDYAAAATYSSSSLGVLWRTLISMNFMSFAYFTLRLALSFLHIWSLRSSAAVTSGHFPATALGQMPSCSKFWPQMRQTLYSRMANTSSFAIKRTMHKVHNLTIFYELLRQQMY